MSDLIKCKACDKEISKNAKTCPNCGEKNKKSSWFVKSLIGIVAFLIFLSFLDGGSTPSSVASAPRPTEPEYADAIGLDYRASSLEQIDRGQLMQFDGEVLQVAGSRSVRFATGSAGIFGYSGDDVLLNFSDNPNVIEKDILSVKGRYDGVMSYETIFGATRTIPRIYVDYYEVTKPRQ